MERLQKIAARAIRVAMAYTSNTKHSEPGLSVDIEYSSPRTPALSKYIIRLVQLCYNRKDVMEIFARDNKEHVRLHLLNAEIAIYTGESITKQNPVRIPKDYLDRYKSLIHAFRLMPTRVEFIGSEPEILTYLRGNPEPGVEVSMRISRRIWSRRKSPRKDRFGELVRWIANNAKDKNRWFRTHLGSRPVLYLNDYTHLSYEPVRCEDVFSLQPLRLRIFKTLRLRPEERDLLKEISKSGFYLKSFSIKAEEYELEFRSIDKEIHLEMKRRNLI